MGLVVGLGGPIVIAAIVIIICCCCCKKDRKIIIKTSDIEEQALQSKIPKDSTFELSSKM